MFYPIKTISFTLYPLLLFVSYSGHFLLSLDTKLSILRFSLRLKYKHTPYISQSIDRPSILNIQFVDSTGNEFYSILNAALKSIRNVSYNSLR